MTASVPETTKKWVVREYPPASNMDVNKMFELTTGPVIGDASTDGKIVIKLLYFSNDPAQRTWIGDFDPKKHYLPPVKKGNTMASFGCAEVVQSFHPDFKVGDMVASMFGWAEYMLVDVATARQSVFPLQKLPQGVHSSDMLASATGMTAYFGLFNVVNATKDDKVIIVSGAAGATGNAVTQFAKKVLGIDFVIGIAGSDEKCRLCREVGGCDLAVNYKSDNWRDEVYKAVDARGGADIYFDNVGGAILEFVLLKCMKREGRIAACGAIAGYDNDAGVSLSAKAWRHIIFQTLTVKGFLVGQFAKEMGKSQADMIQWMKEGKYTPLKDLWKAKFEEVPHGMTKLFRGDNKGKLITCLDDGASATDAKGKGFKSAL